MDFIERAVCFTGHRDMHDIDNIRTRLYTVVEELINKGYRFFLAGGARGFDTLAAQTVLALKEKYPHIKLITVLPFKNPFEHERGWSMDDINAHMQCLRRSDRRLLLFPHYQPGCYYARDRYMVDHASVCVSYLRRTSGGTAYTVSYANRMNKELSNV